jgi:hypothetical protein
MTVKKLIKKLSKMDQNLPVVLGCGSSIETITVERYNDVCPGIGEAPRDDDNDDKVVLIG